MDWNSLQLVGGSFIDAEFTASSSDLLYTARIDGKTAYLYILFEHQNTEDPWISLRLLTYIVRIWNDHVRNNPRDSKLPPILPLVLAQDNKPWKTSTRFSDIVAAPAGLEELIKNHTPDFEFQLMELFRMPYDKILGTPAGILALRAVKAEKLAALLEDPVWDESLLVELSPQAFEMLMRYIFDRDIDKPAFRRRLESITNPKLSKNAMSLAEQFRQEGRQEGRISTQQQAVIEVLEIRFERVPEGLKEAIHGVGDMIKLTSLHRAAICCADLESFATEL